MTMVDGKAVMITGASGIAAASARLAASRGAKVFIAGLDPAQCESLAQEVNGAFYAGDLSEELHAEAAVAGCVNAFGAVDALFNVAGISGRKLGDGPLHECSAAGWDATFTNNARSMFLVSRAALAVMMPARSGSIVNMSSVLAFSPEARHFASHAYAATKGAVLALTTAMAAYYAIYKIRVNAIAPGLVETPMSRRAHADPAIAALLRTKQPLREGLLAPEDVASAALFLLGGESAGVTGQVLTVDAGWTVSA